MAGGLKCILHTVLACSLPQESVSQDVGAQANLLVIRQPGIRLGCDLRQYAMNVLAFDGTAGS
jgi:hypothetical protein